jgi:hypothetical protein
VPPVDTEKTLLYTDAAYVYSALPAQVKAELKQSAVPHTFVPEGHAVFQHMFFSGVKPGIHFG